MLSSQTSSVTRYLALAVLLTGCNMLTTADRLSIDYDQDGEGNEAATSSASGSGQQAGGVGGSTSVSSTGAGETGATSGAGAGDTVPNEVDIAAPGVALTRVTLNQGVSRTLMEQGNTSSDSLPIAAERPGLLRVFYETYGEYNGQPVTARLSLSGGKVIEQQVSLGANSNEGSLASTVNFDLAADEVSVGESYRIDFLQKGDAADDEPSARYPQDPNQTESLKVQPSSKLSIVIVPITYNGDGSGRKPDTSAAQIKLYRDEFFAMYPVRDVELSVRQPIVWNQSVSAGGGGWSNLLNAVQNLRAQDGVDSGTYYYGIFAPASSVQSYCSGGCVQGLGFLASQNAASFRAAIGIGYSGLRSVEVALHELGHNHGREHAPCGVAGDPNYPHAKGNIGRFGYHLFNKKLFAPGQYVDMMSYCDPAWISDYTYNALYQRSLSVKSMQAAVPPEQMEQVYERYEVDAHGGLRKLSPIRLKHPPTSDAYAQVTMATTAGVQRVSAPFARYDHLPGGTLLVPPPSTPSLAVTVVDVKLHGQQLALP